MVPKNVKANHVVSIALNQNWSRISADCQQKLISSEYDTGKRFLLITFGEQKRERHAEITCYPETLSPLHLLVDKLRFIQ